MYQSASSNPNAKGQTVGQIVKPVSAVVDSVLRDKPGVAGAANHVR